MTFKKKKSPSANSGPQPHPVTRKGWALGVLGFTQDGLGCPHRCSRWDTVQGRLFFFGDIYNKNSRWGITIGGSFRDFLFSSRKLGKIPILTHIFQMGRNHQLDNYSISKNKQQKGPNKKKHTHLEMIYLQNKTEIFRSEQSGVQGGFIPFFEWKFRFQIFFIFTPIWGRFPIRLIFFKGVETTNYVVFFGFEKTSFAA